MANQVQVFENEQFGQVRTVIRDGEPWFVAADVCRALEIDRSQSRRLDEDEKAAVCLTHTSSNGTEQGRDVTIINEPGLYSLVLGSRKPEAKDFKRWVTHDILPSIRRHGLYATDEVLKQMIVSPELVKGMAEQLIAERAKVKEQADTIAVQEKSIERMKPKEDYCDKVLSSPNAVPITVIAKDYGFSAQAMNEMLYVLGVQYKRGQTWVLKQEYARAGYTKSYTYLAPSGESVVQTRWTQKGRLFIYELLKKERGILPLDGKAA